jgi:integrase
MLAEPKERVRWITPAEAIKLLEVLPGRVRLIVEWALCTGCRRSEILKLRWDDVDLERHQAHIEGKTGHRTLWLSAEACAILGRAEKVGAFVFDGTNLRKHFELGIRTSGLRDFKFHDLRHTHATWLRMAGVPLEIVQRSLGHTAITTTSRYAHVADTEIQAALRKLPSLVPESVGANIVALKRKAE